MASSAELKPQRRLPRERLLEPLAADESAHHGRLALSFPPLGTPGMIDRRDDDGHVGITWRLKDGRLSHGLTTAEYGEQLEAESQRRDPVAHLRLLQDFRRTADRFGIAHSVPPADEVNSPPTTTTRPQGRTGRAPRLATNARRRGSRRASAQTRAEPGSDDGPSSEGDGEPPPPPARKQLAGPSPRFSGPWRRVDDRLAELVDELTRAAS